MPFLITIFRSLLFYLIPIFIGYLASFTAKVVIKKRPSLISKIFSQAQDNLLGERDSASAMTLLRVAWFFCLGVLILLLIATGIGAFLSVTGGNLQFMHIYFPVIYTLFFTGGVIACVRTVFNNSLATKFKEALPM